MSDLHIWAARLLPGAWCFSEPTYERTRQLWCAGTESGRDAAWQYVMPLTTFTRMDWIERAQEDCGQ